MVSAVRALRRQYSSAQVVITGHSLGGAMAALAAVGFVSYENIPVSRVYTFGQPRTGNQAFSDFVRNIVPNFYRITNNQDLVVHSPPRWTGFYHVRREIYYWTSNGYRACDQSGEDSNCANQWNMAWQWSVDDHLNYLGYPIGSDAC